MKWWAELLSLLGLYLIAVVVVLSVVALLVAVGFLRFGCL